MTAMPTILYGRPAQEAIASRLKAKIGDLDAKPALAIVQVGNNPESNSYIKRKIAFGQKIGAQVKHLRFPETVSFSDLKLEIGKLNNDSKINGIIIQLPLPKHLSEQLVTDLITPAKDVDGLTSENQKLLASGKPRFVPATALGILELLRFYKIAVKGKKVCVMGQSILTGSPAAKLLALEGGEVSVLDSATREPKSLTNLADILVVAIGNAKFVEPSYVKPGAVVVDVGFNVNKVTSRDIVTNADLVGDVDFEAVKAVASAITPVPGGVGPMTVAALFENLLSACQI